MNCIPEFLEPRAILWWGFWWSNSVSFERANSVLKIKVACLRAPNSSHHLSPKYAMACELWQMTSMSFP